MSKNILVTGGTGKTGSRVAELLRAEGAVPRIASRNPKTAETIRFQWSDPSSFEAAFRDVEAVYLVAPTDTFDSIGAMQPALEFAQKVGVSRFILLSASSLKEGDAMMGAVHSWLRTNVSQWAVLRPSWFMQNFSEGQHLVPIRDEFAIYSATENGRVGFIDADDIARTAVTLLLAPEIENTDHILTGPDKLTYNDVTVLFSEKLSRNIEHKRLTVDDIAKRFRDMGFPENYAKTLAAMDGTIASGAEDNITNNIKIITGEDPIGFDEFISRNLNVWRTSSGR